jgi:hypothetical protein
MTVIVLCLVGLMVFVVTVSPPQEGSPTRENERGGATPTAVAQAPLTDPDAFDVSEELSAAPGGEPQTVEAEIGDRVQLVVDAPAPDSVALGDLSINDVEPGAPARFELLADTPGAYPVVLVNENRRIGTLQIR